MNKTLATLGVLGAAGALSICDLCTPGARPATLVSVAHAAPARAPAASPAQPALAASAARRAAAAQTVAFKVQGMTCGGCVIGVRTVLTRLPGVARADVSYEQSRAVVTYDPAKVTVGQMVAAIRTLGYTATVVAG